MLALKAFGKMEEAVHKETDHLLGKFGQLRNSVKDIIGFNDRMMRVMRDQEVQMV